MTSHGFCTLAAAAALLATQAQAETMRSAVVVNTGVQQKAAEQPADGLALVYPIALTGALDGCEADVAETLYPRDEGKWGIYELAADVTCADGGFAFTAAGSWDGKGFHGSGGVTEGSGAGRFAGLEGRVAQSGGFSPGADGTTDIAYDLVIDAALR